MTEYKDKYGNTYYVHNHKGGGWGVRVEDKLRKRIRWSRAGALCGHETADQALEALDKYAKKLKKEIRQLQDQNDELTRMCAPFFFAAGAREATE